MSKNDDDVTNASIVPLMPTGNGVTDLETAREQAAVGGLPEQPPMDDAAGGPQAEDTDAPIDDDRPRLSE